MSDRHRRAEAPLLSGDKTQPDAQVRRSHLVKKIAIACAGIGAVLLSAALPPAPRLVWNVSPSAPIGLYVITPDVALKPGDMAVAWAPKRFRQLAAERRYLPFNVPLVKHVAAYGGDKLCARGMEISINNHPVTRRRAFDAMGRPMPLWTGCLRLRGRQIFLLSDNPASFDGRYFGVTAGREVVGKARLLWRR